MSLSATTRTRIPYVVAIALAGVVVGTARLFDASPGFAYGLAGFFLGILIIGGPIFAFGLRGRLFRLIRPSNAPVGNKAQQLVPSVRTGRNPGR